MKISKAITLFALAGLTSTANAALADGGAKFVGNITTGGQVRADMGTYWNQITAENECKWESIDKGNGNYTFGGCDAAYNWAQQEEGRHFKFHALIWGSQFPSRLCKDNNPNISVEETANVIDAWFKAVHNHYPDLEMIDVVNEAIWTGSNYHSGYDKANSNTDGCQSGSKIIEALGGDVENGQHTYKFVINAFKKARELWPNAILIYNDYNTLKWDVDKGIDLVKKLIAAGAPVDAYGLQAHDLDDMGADEFATTMTHIHDEVGIPIYITEYDIDNSDDNAQKNIIAGQVPFMWETEWVAGITFWGYVNGSTWRGNTGLLQSNGSTERESMKWLKNYFSQHLADGQNTTGLNGSTAAEPELQKPFRGVPFDILADRIEAEDFDIPGVGRNADGTSNKSYSDSDAENKGESTYREGTGVDIKDNVGSNQHAIGWNATGDWLEYTINVPEAGEYTLFAAVSGEGGQLQFSLDGKDIGDLLTVSKSNAEPSDEEVDEAVYGDFFKVKTNVTLPAGQHILRMTVVQQWFDLDFFNFVKGKDAEDNAPVGTAAIAGDFRMSTPHMVEYDLIDIHGARLGHISAHSLNEAIVNARNSSKVKSMGIYYLRSRATGKIHSFRVVK